MKTKNIVEYWMQNSNEGFAKLKLEGYGVYMPFKNPILLNSTFSDVISKSEENEFNKELINRNFYQSQKLNVILIFISVILLFTDFLYQKKGLWTSLPGYKYLFYAHLSMLFVSIVLLLFSKGIKPKTTRAKQLFVMIVAYFVTLNCTLISIIDQLIHGQITVFIIGAFTIAVMNTFKPSSSLRIYLTNYLILIIGITFSQENSAALRGHYTNGTILVVVAWFLSILLYDAKVRDFLSRKTIEHQRGKMEKANERLTDTNYKLEESLSALDDTQNIIFSLALALESKDPYIHGHSDRVAESAVEFARYLNLSESDQVNIHRAAILHDLGKIGIPDVILNKTNQLTEEEWLTMKSHPERGAAICSKLNFAKEIVPIIRHHHERYDGKGYPDGLSGESIPLLARIISIADTVDAMTSSRPYRSAGTFEQVLEELQKCAGTQFDPVLVFTFISLYQEQGQRCIVPNSRVVES
ncbi:HD-GYP domain-containing protein [Desulfitobacterium sp.]|uniref:HD-GYP domain-containing protein n=1 Tax=Desulfitobacterium sp. TaxID=49981 RepID=UPI002CF023C8|nr:HD-GYP domain-containing protein [Desulfitobacterium sp.]HVJ50108.1 HD-GYP domain-containing protein [Desulfitobacterium sp.]